MSATQGERQPSRHREDGLRPLLDPRSIAVVGASADPAKRGFQIVRALGASGYRGAIYPVNPKGGSLLGHAVYPDVGALPDGVDLAVLCTPAASAPDLVAACAARGVRAAIVLAVGFRESGAEGAALEERLVLAARDGGIRVLGPNTSGLANLRTGANLIGVRGIRPGGLALLVQSGNMALALMNEVTAKSWDGISVCVGLGNEADVGFDEALDELVLDEGTRGVIVYAEGFRDARSFLASAAAAARELPVVLVKAGRSERGAAAALSHTGAVAGPYDRLRAGLAQAGVTEVSRTDEILHVAETLAGQPAAGGGIVVLSDGGGQGTLAVDALGDRGGTLAELSEGTRVALRTLLGRAAAVGNPVDLAGAADADPTVFARALSLVADDPAVGCVLVVGLFGGYAIRFAEGLAEAETVAAREMAERMRAMGKGLVVHSMYASSRSVPLEALGRRGVPVVESLDTACRCVIELQRRGRRLDRRPWDPTLPSPSRETPAPLALAREEGRTALTEVEARELLERYGVTFAPGLVATDEEGAARAQEELGGPVAMKVVSSTVIHKTDAGGVRLGVGSPDEARTAFREIDAAVAAWEVSHGLSRASRSVLVTPMAPAPDVELLVGAYRDPGLGPVLSLGSGGVLVEVLADVAHRVLPVVEDDIAEMLAELRIAPLLEGVRGRARVDRESVVSVAASVARCILDCPEVAEIEINPLFAYGSGVRPVDARVIRAGPGGA